MAMLACDGWTVKHRRQMEIAVSALPRALIGQAARLMSCQLPARRCLLSG
jgi:hypothetical protein